MNLRVKRYVEKHKDEINARRREKRKQKKEQASETQGSVIPESSPSIQPESNGMLTE